MKDDVLCSNQYNFDQKKYDEEVIKLFDNLKTFQLYFYTMISWMKLVQSGGRLSFFLKNKRIALYGGGKVGELVFDELRQDGIKIECIIDQGGFVPWLDDIRVYTLDDNLPIVDIILVTVTPCIDEIELAIREKGIESVIVTVDDVCNALMR